MVLCESKGINTVKLSNKSSGVRDIFLPRTVETICSFESAREIPASVIDIRANIFKWTESQKIRR